MSTDKRLHADVVAPRSVTFDAVQMLTAAMTAPTGDNCQPWRFRLLPDGFEVRHQPLRAKSLLDPKHLASRLALGALLEATKLNAGQRGLETTWVIDPEPEEATLWARVTFCNALCDADALSAVLFERETNRRAFDRSPLLAREQQSLVSVSGGALELLAKRSSIRSAAQLARKAEYLRAESREAHLELHSWLRWSADDVRKTRDGLDVRTLGLNAVQWVALKATERWPVRQLALGTASATAAYAASLIDSASGVGLISTDDGDAVSAGRAMLRVWLRATQLGLAFSPMAALPLLIARCEHTPQSFSPAQRKLLGDLRSRLAELFMLGPSARPLFMFRVGRAERMNVRSVRLDVRHLLD